jgi:large subunit ribosomal protein L22e
MTKKILKNPEQNKVTKFTIDLGVTVDDNLVNPKEIVDYLKSSIKINGQQGLLGDNVTVTLVGTKSILVSTRVRVAKRYLKYLMKRILKKVGILEYLKINATEKNVYKLKYLKSEVKEQ